MSRRPAPVHRRPAPARGRPGPSGTPVSPANRRLFLIDLGIAAVVAILVLVITPGLAVAGVLALLVLLLYGVTFGVRRWRRRSVHERALRRFPR